MIAFIVSSFRYNNTGAGGHYYTTLSLFQEVKKHRPAIMLVIGDQRPLAVDFTIDGIFFIPVNRRLRKSDFIRVNDTIKSFKIKLLHAFDTYAFLFSRIACYSLNTRAIITKCGGPKPILFYYPGIRPDTVFSIEDLEYFSNRTRFFKLAPPVLLPNRVGSQIKFKPLPDEQALPDKDVGRSTKIIRIGRISKSYELSFFQTIALAKQLRAKGFDIALYIVGYIEDATIYEKIRLEMDPRDYLLTEESYTRNAARHLHNTDIVVASGRGVMEASVSKKIILCSVKDASLPYLMDDSTFLHFFRYNFSSRAARPDISEDKNIQNIIEIISNPSAKAQYLQTIKNIYNTYFDISSVIPSYFQLYDNKTDNRNAIINAIDLIIHWVTSVVKLKIREN